MRLKTFYGPTMTDAMREVREALGENAIIIATRDDEAGGTRITAAFEEAPLSDDATALARELSANGSKIIEIIAGELLKHQVPPSMAERLLAAATQFANDDPVLALGSAFDTHLKFRPIIKNNDGKPLMFVGPPGAGKTLCTAKFATIAKLTKKPVAVISTDTERAGGMEQLAAFTRLLKLDLIEIEDAPSVHEAITLNAKSFIVIDTPARNPFREKERQQLRSLIEACGEAVLVLPADMDSSESIDMINEFRSVGATRLLITRLDMARRLGPLLRTAFETRMPLANFSATPKVTEPPQPFNPIALAKLVLPKEASGIQHSAYRNKAATA
jgi:flagellar biosynthesis protein FlhF